VETIIINEDDDLSSVKQAILT